MSDFQRVPNALLEETGKTIERLTRERDDLLEREKQNEWHCESLRKYGDALWRERDAARAHFRRACELLVPSDESGPVSGCTPLTADEWQKEIEEETRKHV